jgi:hypothetical protein
MNVALQLRGSAGLAPAFPRESSGRLRGWRSKSTREEFGPEFGPLRAGRQGTALHLPSTQSQNPADGILLSVGGKVALFWQIYGLARLVKTDIFYHWLWF